MSKQPFLNYLKKSWNEKLRIVESSSNISTNIEHDLMKTKASDIKLSSFLELPLAIKIISIDEVMFYRTQQEIYNSKLASTTIHN